MFDLMSLVARIMKRTPKLTTQRFVSREQLKADRQSILNSIARDQKLEARKLKDGESFQTFGLN